MNLLDILRGGTPRDRFARRMMKRLSGYGWPDKVTYDRERFALECLQNGELPLEEAFQKADADPDFLRKNPDGLLAALFDPGPGRSFEEAAPDLRLAVKTRSLVEMTKFTDARDPFHWPGAGLAVLDEIGDYYVVVLAVDRSPFPQVRLAADVEAWGVPAQALLARAVENMRRRPLGFRPGPGGFLLSAGEDAYHAGWLMLPDLFTGLDLKGAPVVVPMMSESIAVAGADDAEALLAMARYVEPTVESDIRAFGFGPLVLQAGQWRRFEPDAPELRPLADLWSRQRLWDYQSVEGPLQTWLERRRSPDWVGSYTRYLDGDRPVTLSIWLEDETPVLLGRADAVLFGPDGDKPFARSWHDVAGLVPFEEDDRFWPPRMRAAAWPALDTMQALKALPPAPGWAPRA